MLPPTTWFGIPPGVIRDNAGQPHSAANVGEQTAQGRFDLESFLSSFRHFPVLDVDNGRPWIRGLLKLRR